MNFDNQTHEVAESSEFILKKLQLTDKVTGDRIPFEMPNLQRTLPEGVLFMQGDYF
jgi:hypothetical protein